MFVHNDNGLITVNRDDDYNGDVMVMVIRIVMVVMLW